MAELVGNIFRGDSWEFPGGKDTQILHTNSEDMISDSPTQAKVEEQSSHKKSAPTERIKRIDASKLVESSSSPSAAARISAANEAAPMDAVNAQVPTNLALSNSSNSSASCMPRVGMHPSPSFDIRASARAEQLHHNSSQGVPNQAEGAAASHNGLLSASLQPQNMLPSSLMQTVMASMFDDVDSGRHQHAEASTAAPSHSQFRGHRHSPRAQDSLPAMYRQFFPEDNLPPLHHQQQQQQLSNFQLAQLLPPQLRGDPKPSKGHQHGHQQNGFLGLPSLQQSAATGMLSHPMDTDQRQQMHIDSLQQWPSPVAQLPSPGSAAQARQRGAFAATNPHIKLEDLDLSGVKRDFNSFTGPTASSRHPKPSSIPRRALSFTGGSAASAASTAAHAEAGVRRAQGSSNQAASHSRLASPGSNMTSPPDTDASVSDSEELSGSDSGGTNTKRRRVVKGKRGGGRRPRRMVCRNCGAHQTPQWRCGPEGPRTLCNACGVRYKKGLPLNGASKLQTADSMGGRQL